MSIGANQLDNMSMVQPLDYAYLPLRLRGNLRSAVFPFPSYSFAIDMGFINSTVYSITKESAL